MVKPGYKETEIGVIPEDWSTTTLKSAFTKIEAGVSVNSDGSIFSDYYILKTSAVHNGVVTVSEVKPVIRSDYSRLKCPLVKDSILFSRMNTPDLVGECAYNTVASSNVYLPDRLWQIQNTKPLDNNFRWLNYLLNTPKYRDFIRSTATGTSNSMKNISKERLLEIRIPLPSLGEQQKIAEALSDMDELIAALEKLIAKKKVIKQSAMQELLTGKKRLPGFEGKWNTLLLKDICLIIMGQSPDSHYYNQSEGLPLIQGNADIANRRTIVRNLTSQITKTAFKGDIIFTVRAPVGNVAKATFQCCLGRGVCALRSENDFLYHYLVYKEPSWSAISAGSTFDSISGKELEKTSLYIPTDVHEQQAIASILSDMDAEIEALEQELTKCRQTKQGIMQQLLTGKIRLV